MPHRKTLFIGDVLSSKIVTAQGRRIGHVVDIECTPGRTQRVTALVFGKYGWLYRWHVPHPFAKKLGLRIEPDTLPWDAVESFEHLTVKLKPGREPQRKR